MKPLVSICCITYNHEKYIAEAIESFLMQETDFPIEIIIHDDASTDRTPEIIKEYEEKYPDIIRPIYQKENQFSKDRQVSNNFVAPIVKGKYVATCEGDDYWTDPKKLQKQVEFLQKNNNYLMCFHGVKVVDINRNCKGEYLGPVNKGSRDYTIKDTTEGGFIHVSSRMIKSEYYKSIPNWVKNAYHSDYATAIYFSAEGQIYFMDEVMSARRIGVENSMMTNFRNKATKEVIIGHYINAIETFDMADQYYSYKFHDEIELGKLRYGEIIANTLFDKDKKTNKTQKELLELISLKYKFYIEKGIRKIELKDEYKRFIERFSNNQKSANIINYFTEKNYKRIAIYGAGTLGKLLYNRLKDTHIEVLFYIEDRDYSDIENNIFSLKQLNIDTNVDSIIVTPFYDFDNIKKLLKNKVTNTEIISMYDIFSNENNLLFE